MYLNLTFFCLGLRWFLFNQILKTVVNIPATTTRERMMTTMVNLGPLFVVSSSSCSFCILTLTKSSLLLSNVSNGAGFTSLDKKTARWVTTFNVFVVVCCVSSIDTTVLFVEDVTGTNSQMGQQDSSSSTILPPSSALQTSVKSGHICFPQNGFPATQVQFWQSRSTWFGIFSVTTPESSDFLRRVVVGTLFEILQVFFCISDKQRGQHSPSRTTGSSQLRSTAHFSVKHLNSRKSSINYTCENRRT